MSNYLHTAYNDMEIAIWKLRVILLITIALSWELATVYSYNYRKYVDTYCFQWLKKILVLTEIDTLILYFKELKPKPEPNF